VDSNDWKLWCGGLACYFLMLFYFFE
jgi:hypothetical protein